MLLNKLRNKINKNGSSVVTDEQRLKKIKLQVDKNGVLN